MPALRRRGGLMRGQGIRLAGLAAALVVTVLDQLSKVWILDLMAQQVPPVIRVTGFFNLVQVWNTGVSFGLFQHDSEMRSLLLIGVAAAVMVWLLVWLWRGTSRLAGLALGIIIGGALGNIIDRWRHGAVYDFLDLHAFGWHWPAFNLADSAIVIGVGLLLLDGFRPASRAGG
ncbi:signal peptidase II [Ferrovibrio sp.]|uniref:signal peptidase II n=1 Tax=Ferrovibrio sp. TaxID=1917215 RepID=UPI0035131768